MKICFSIVICHVNVIVLPCMRAVIAKNACIRVLIARSTCITVVIARSALCDVAIQIQAPLLYAVIASVFYVAIQ